MQRKDWIIVVCLSLVSLGVIFTRQSRDEGSIELPSLTPTQANEVRAEIEKGPDGSGELMVYATTLDDEIEALDVQLPGRDEMVTISRRDLELGTRIDLPPETVEAMREQARSAAPPVARDTSRPIQIHAEVLDAERRIRLDPHTTEPEATLPVPPPPTTTIVWTLEPGRCRLTERGVFEVPVIAVARKTSPDGSLPLTTVSRTTKLLVTAGGIDPGELSVEAGHFRSPEPIFVPLRRTDVVRVTASPVAGGGTPAILDLSWEEHGPRDLQVVVSGSTETLATRLSPLTLDVHATAENRLLRPPRALPIIVQAPAGVLVEPIEPKLEGDTPARLVARAENAVDDILTITVPDLDVEAEVTVQFRRPWHLLAIAALLGVVGVAVARRKALLDQSKVALAFEIVAAIAGGVLLYSAFLVEWLPAPGGLLGELSAGAVGILGGYAGEGVFQVLTKLLKLRS